MSSRPHRRAMEEDQLKQLNRLLAVLVGKNAFYTEKMRKARVNFPFASLQDFFRQMPFTTKQELVNDQQSHPPFGSNLTFPPETYTRYHQTSGTTRKPLRWLDTEDSWRWMLNTWKQVFQAAEVTKEDRVFFAFSFGPFLGFWTAFDAAGALGCLCIPGGGMSSAARLQTIIDLEATVLCCTPTYSLRLAEAAAEHRIDIASTRIRKIIVGGEPGAGLASTRQRIERAWNGARLFDHHGMTEIGPVSYESIHSPGSLHVDESAFIAEILDPENLKPVQSGETGELVLTNLGRDGMPLIRYRTNDLVKPDWSGQPKFTTDRLALEGGIIGRLDDMVVVRGVNLYPTAVEEILRFFDEIAEYQALIYDEHSLKQLQLKIEPVEHCQNPSSLAQSIEKAFREAFHLRVPVTLARIGSLPRYELKAKRWIRLDLPPQQNDAE